MAYEDNPIVRLSQRQFAWLCEMTQVDFNATEAAARVYRCKNRKVARQIGYRNRRRLREAFAITEDRHLLHRARRFARALARDTEASTTRRFRLAGGGVLVCEVPDWRKRLRALNRICRLGGWFPPPVSTLLQLAELLKTDQATEVLRELTPRFLQLIADGKAPPYKLTTSTHRVGWPEGG